MIAKYFDGDFLLKYVKWTPSKPNESTGPVKEVSSRDFDSVVTNSGRDAFIMFYKPTCSHCIAIQPVWEQLGREMKDEDINVIKMDAVANKSPRPYVVNSFPTIYMKFGSNIKPPMKFTGERSHNGFIKFMCKYATNELIGWDRKGKPRKMRIP